MSIQYSNDHSISKPEVQVKLLTYPYHIKYKALIDSGSEITLVQKTVIDNTQVKIKSLLDQDFTISGYGGQIIEHINSYIELNIHR